ncbi:MAG: hypothetical protein ABI384_05980 [Allobranchiibius sp.]
MSSGARSYSIAVLTHSTTASMSTQIATIAGTSRMMWGHTVPGTVQLFADIAGYYLAGTPTTPGAYAPLPAYRVLDTRYGIGAPKVEVAPGGTVHLQVTGRGGVPTFAASAVALNVTVTTPTRSGWITAYADGAEPPTTSNLNYAPRQTVSNLVISKLGADGRIALTNNSTGTVQLFADIAGYYLAGTPTTPGAYAPLPPARVLDTRTSLGATGPVPAHGTVHLQIAGKGGVPATGVSAVVVNATVTASTRSGWITAYADGAATPTTSNLNYAPGQTVPNLVIAKLGAAGRIALTNNSTGTVQLFADIAGYYLAGTPTTPGAYVPLTPTRLMDTRTNVGATGPVPAHGTAHLQIAGKGGVPATGISAVMVNVTVTGPTAAGTITVYPDGTTMPTASNLNFTAGQTIPHLVLSKLGADGRIALTNNS